MSHVGRGPGRPPKCRRHVFAAELLRECVGVLPRGETEDDVILTFAPEPVAAHPMERSLTDGPSAGHWTRSGSWRRRHRQ
jgi:hypothetical protein